MFTANVDVKPDGAYSAELNIRKGIAPGKYHVVAVVDKQAKSQPMTFDAEIAFPNVYLANAGTSLNIFYPFILSLCVAIFGVLMGAGGAHHEPASAGPVPVLPHTVVAGTVTPTVLFSQGSGILNYSKISSSTGSWAAASVSPCSWAASSAQN